MYRDPYGGISTVTNDPAHDSDPALSGDTVAWVKYGSFGSEIWLGRPDWALPELTVEEPLANTLLGGSPGDAALVKGTAADDTGVAEVRISFDGETTWHRASFDSGLGTPSATWHFDWPLPAEDYVAHELQFEVRDAAGRNFIPETGIRTVYVDTIAPRLGLFCLNTGDPISYSQLVLVTLEAFDASPQVEASLNNLGYSPSDWSGRRRLFTWRLEPGPGLRTVQVRLGDSAGNLSGPWTASVTVEQGPFRDVTPGHPQSLAIYSLRAAGIVHGYTTSSGSEFRPEDNLLRAQFAKMICGALGLLPTEDMTSPFLDLGRDDPADLYPHQYVAAAYAAGITTGTSATLFSPWASITRAQLVTMTVRALQARAPGALADPPPSWTGALGAFDATHGPTMRLAEYNGMLEGMAGFGPSWNPWAKASRGEAAELLFRMIMILEM